jgi:hypothetical protein
MLRERYVVCYFLTVLRTSCVAVPTQLYNEQQVTSGAEIGFDPVKGSAWFEYLPTHSPAINQLEFTIRFDCTTHALALTDTILGSEQVSQ